MYYRVAIQADPPPSWQWKSSALSSLDALFQWLRCYRALPLDRLRVFSSSSRAELHEQLAQENKGLESSSVTAARFLQERKISVREVTWEASIRGTRENERTSSLTVATELATPLTGIPSTWPAPHDSSKGAHTRDERDMLALDRRRLELERGAGGDHDRSYVERVMWRDTPAVCPSMTVYEHWKHERTGHW
jgi:hypothetical protein